MGPTLPRLPARRRGAQAGAQPRPRPQLIGDGLLAALESRQCSHQGILQAGASNGTNERGMAIDIELAATTTVPLVVRPRPGNAAGRIYRDVPFPAKRSVCRSRPHAPVRGSSFGDAWPSEPGEDGRASNVVPGSWHKCGRTGRWALRRGQRQGRVERLTARAVCERRRTRASRHRLVRVSTLPTY